MAVSTGDDEPDQGPLFELEVDDDDGCVWLVTGSGEDARTLNLGPREAVASKFAEWLAASGDCGEDSLNPE